MVNMNSEPVDPAAVTANALDTIADANVDILNAVLMAEQTGDTFAIAEAASQMDVAQGAIVEIFSVTPDDLG
jgi:3-dehydroquinate dehydratase